MAEVSSSLFFLLHDAARESPIKYPPSFLPVFPRLCPPPFFSLRFQLRFSPLPLLSGLNLMPPARDDSLCCYVEEEKEEEEEGWRRCGERETFLFSLALIMSPLESMFMKKKKNKLFPCFFFPVLFHFPPSSLKLEFSVS